MVYRRIAVNASFALYFLEVEEIGVSPIRNSRSLRWLDFISVEIFAPNIPRLVNLQLVARSLELGSEGKGPLFSPSNP